MKKIPGDIIILHKCTKNYDQMMYSSWDMVCDRCNYFSFWAIFCPFTPLTAQKIKILKKWKKHLEISSFYICVPKIMIRWCTIPEIWCVTEGRTVIVKIDLVSMMFCFVTLILYPFNEQWCRLDPLLKQICIKSYKFILVSVPIWYQCPLKG